MGDYSYITATIYACPDEHAEAVTDLLNEYIYDGDGELPQALLSHHAIEERYIGTGRDLGQCLIQISPDITFVIVQEPKYEWTGDLIIQVAGMHSIALPCGPNGEPIVDIDVISTAILTAPDVTEADAAVRRLYGADLMDAIKKLDN